MNKYKVGDIVKFLDSLWNERKIIGNWGLFSPALKENAENKFTVVKVNIQDEDSIEYQLKEFPWLVYEKEIEKING